MGSVVQNSVMTPHRKTTSLSCTGPLYIVLYDLLGWAGLLRSAAGEITREGDTHTIIMAETGPREQYYKLRRTYDPAGDITPTDFYYTLRSVKQECLLKGAASGGNVTFQGQVPVEDEVLTATLESDIVADWLEAIGGGQLLEYVMKVFSDDLKKETLYDLYPRISDHLESLKIDMNLTSEASDDTEFHPNALVAFGGTLDPWEDEYVYLQTGEVYDFQTNQWSSLGNMLQETLRGGAVTVRGKVYIIGGQREYDRVNSVDAYDPDTDTWTYNMPSMSAVRLYPGVAVLNDKIYVAGGSHLNTAEMLDLSIGGTHQWKPIASMNIDRQEFGMGALEGKIYAVGGIKKVPGARFPKDFAKGILSSVEMYDPEQDVWTTGADLSSPRSGSSVAVLNGFLYCVGGTTDTLRKGVLKMVEKYDPNTNTWTRVADMNHPRTSAGIITRAGIVTRNGSLYVVGGDDGIGCRRDIEVYDPMKDIWIVIPGEMSQKRCEMAVALIEKK